MTTQFERDFARGTEGFENATNVSRYTHSHTCRDTNCGAMQNEESFSSNPCEMICDDCDGAMIAVPDEEGESEAGFSRSPCDICGSGLAGTRYHMILWNGGLATHVSRIEVEACADCMSYAEYGRID
jgi:hypothetical protein